MPGADRSQNMLNRLNNRRCVPVVVKMYKLSSHLCALK